MRGSDVAAVLAVLLAVTLVAALGGGTPPVPSAAQRARTVPVEQATLACPAATEPETVSAAVSSPRLPDPPDLPASPVRIGSDRGRVARLDHRGATWSGDPRKAARGLQATAEGALAAGLNAAVAAVLDDDRRGLVAAPCPRPASHWWFVGTASSSDRSAVLDLANPSPGVAVVDLAFYGPDGPIEPAAGQGLAVAPGARTSLPLTDLVPGAEPVTVEVTARQGRVAASLTETARDVLDPAGAEVLAAAAEPRRTAALTGIPGGPGEHTLSVVNAGAGATVVRLEVLGPRGSFTPTELENLRVPAGGTAQATVPAGVFDGDTAGLRLRADHPVTASVRTSAGSPLQDLSFAVAGDPVDAVAATPLLPGLEGRLVLSGTGRTAVTVDVVTSSSSGQTVDRRTLDVGRGQTRTVPIGGRGRAAAVQARTSGPGPLLASVLWTRPDDEGALSSGFPLTSLRLRVDRPAVRYELVP